MSNLPSYPSSKLRPQQGGLGLYIECSSLAERRAIIDALWNKVDDSAGADAPQVRTAAEIVADEDSFFYGKDINEAVSAALASLLQTIRHHQKLEPTAKPLPAQALNHRGDGERPGLVTGGNRW